MGMALAAAGTSNRAVTPVAEANTIAAQQVTATEGDPWISVPKLERRDEPATLARLKWPSSSAGAHTTCPTS
jgi:hypothetical protein